MRIRTRYTLFKGIIALAVVTFLVSLYDIFARDSEWFFIVMAVYAVLALFALVLYIGHKPRLEGEPTPVEPVPVVPDQDVVAEVEPARPLAVEGPHHFRCPFCSNIFALELTHLQKKYELRMDCPFCANTIRIPARPKLAPGLPIQMDAVSPPEQAVFVCFNCGEMLRYSAPGQRAEDHARVRSCPHCGSDQVGPAVGAAA